MAQAEIQPLEVLRSVFGYDAFRSLQGQIIDRVMGGGDALVLMPTGGGKSLCYQIPALMRQGVGIVISPLIALMQNQVAALTQLGVKAAFLNSSLSPDEARQVEGEVLSGRLDLLYVAPERLMTERFQSILDRIRIALFAIDESHCVSQWGHDFRPEYLQLNVLHERYPDVPRIALTATADERTRQEIVQKLNLQGAEQFITCFDRPNIQYRVVLRDSPRKQLLAFLRAEHEGESGIVYCLSRKSTEDVAAWLTEEGYRALPYHAGLDAKVRFDHQQRFLTEDGLIVVATIAFGMGIDKPDVRFVAHLNLPKSLEAYYQETGRAGRDGEPANAWMAYGVQDASMIRSFIESTNTPAAQKRVEHHKFNSLLAYCESTACRRKTLLNYFGQEHQGACGNCDTCLSPVETWDGTVAAQKVLSCVYRTEQLFGAAHIVDVLLGKATEKVQRFGHDTLTTFGIGLGMDAKAWQSIIRQLVASGHLFVDVEGHGSLLLTAKAEEVLKGREAVRFRRDPEPVKAARREKKKPPGKTKPVEFVEAVDQRLFEALRKKRAELAADQGIPPYMIFHNTVLSEMVRVRPGNLKQFGSIAGVGASKLERYGAAFLEVLTDQAV